MNGTIQHIIKQLTPVYDYHEALSLAYWIIEEQCALTRSDILLRREHIVVPELDSILARLLQHEPIQYIFGHTTWLGLDLLVTPATLIPRPETAELIGLLPWNTAPLRILDIGTGSGCIAIATKRARPNWQVSAIDISAEALAVAQQNAHRSEVDIDFHQLDILHATPDKRYDIVISNPPYIRECERDTMSANVLKHEPKGALFVPDTDPLLFYRRIAELHLAPLLFFEINEQLGPETGNMLRTAGYTDIEIHQDIYGKNRFITAQQ